MYLCTRNYDLKRGGTFETAKAGTFHSVTAGTSIPLFTHIPNETVSIPPSTTIFRALFINNYESALYIKINFYYIKYSGFF